MGIAVRSAWGEWGAFAIGLCVGFYSQAETTPAFLVCGPSRIWPEKSRSWGPPAAGELWPTQSAASFPINLLRGAGAGDPDQSLGQEQWENLSTPKSENTASTRLPPAPSLRNLCHHLFFWDCQIRYWELLKPDPRWSTCNASCLFHQAFNAASTSQPWAWGWGWWLGGCSRDGWGGHRLVHPGNEGWGGWCPCSGVWVRGDRSWGEEGWGGEGGSHGMDWVREHRCRLGSAWLFLHASPPAPHRPPHPAPAATLPGQNRVEWAWVSGPLKGNVTVLLCPSWPTAKRSWRKEAKEKEGRREWPFAGFLLSHSFIH